MDTITLTMEEQQRVAVIQRVFRRELTIAEAAVILGVSEGHSVRLKARIRKEGVRGVMHTNRATARIGNCRSRPTDGLWSWPGGGVPGIDDHHQMEELTDGKAIRVSQETVRQILRAEGIVSPRKRR